VAVDAGPTERELEVLAVLWRDGKATVRAVWNELRRRRPDAAYTTVLSLLQVMEAKGLVKHQQSGRAYVYRPAAAKEPTRRRLARRFLDDVFDGAVDECLARLLESKRPSDATLDALERLVAAAKARKRPKPKAEGGP
jgi:predicted transcriptional regulator